MRGLEQFASISNSHWIKLILTTGHTSMASPPQASQRVPVSTMNGLELNTTATGMHLHIEIHQLLPSVLLWVCGLAEPF